MEENKFNDNDVGIDIVDFLMMLWKRKILILPLAIFFAVVMFVKTAFFTVPLYRTNGILYVRTVSNEVAEKENFIYGSDISTARDLTSTYKEILLTRSFLMQVSDAIDNIYSWGQIRSMISVSALGETELLSISVTAHNPQHAYLIAKNALELAPAKFESILNGGDVFIVDEAVYSDYPLGKGTIKMTLIGFAVGLIVGIILAYIINLFDKKIHSGVDVAKKYDISLLGQIVHGISVTKKKGRKQEIADSIENILNEKSLFSTVETYKSIRTNIMYSIPKTDKGKIISVSSSSPAEGKTTTVINTAITFAQTGAKVILLDCDLRKPRVHRYLQLSRDNGISNVLCGFCELDNAIQKSKYDSLDVIAAGEIPSNPAELLNSDEFDMLLKDLQNKYDYIFIDTPPITVVTDALVLMNKCNGVIVVARENYTTFDVLDVTIENIKKLNTKIFGVVIVDATNTKRNYTYYKKNKYSYKYSYKHLYEYRYGDEQVSVEPENN